MVTQVFVDHTWVAHNLTPETLEKGMMQYFHEVGAPIDMDDEGNLTYSEKWSRNVVPYIGGIVYTWTYKKETA